MELNDLPDISFSTVQVDATWVGWRTVYDSWQHRPSIAAKATASSKQHQRLSKRKAV